MEFIYWVILILLIYIIYLYQKYVNIKNDIDTIKSKKNNHENFSHLRKELLNYNNNTIIIKNDGYTKELIHNILSNTNINNKEILIKIFNDDNLIDYELLNIVNFALIDRFCNVIIEIQPIDNDIDNEYVTCYRV